MSKKPRPYEKIPLDPSNERDAEVLHAIKTHERIEFAAYKELIKAGQLEVFANIKTARKIFFDTTTEMFCYYSPYHRSLRKCAKWKDE